MRSEYMKKLELSTKEYQLRLKEFEVKRDAFDKKWGPVKAEHAKLKGQLTALETQEEETRQKLGLVQVLRQNFDQVNFEPISQKT